MTADSTVSQLLAEARSRNGSAVSRLLDMYRHYLRLLARMQLDDELRNRVSPSDVVQESLVTAHESFGEFRGSTEAELLAWLRKVLATRLIDFRRFHTAQRRDARLDKPFEDDVERSSVRLGTLLPVDANSPSQIAMRRERAVLLADALQRLPVDYAEVIVQHHLEGRAFPEIAERLDRSVPSVKGVWARAMTRLRTELRAIS